MVTRGTAGILTGATAPKSREDSKQGSSSCISHDAHSELESKSTGQESPTAGSQTASTWQSFSSPQTWKPLTWPRAGVHFSLGSPFSYSQAALSFWVMEQGALENSEAGRVWSLWSSHQVFELESWKVKRWPWACLVWLSWLRADPCTKRSMVRFQVKVHAWVAGSVPQ